MTKEQECMKALQCLYLEVPSVIADDIKQKVIDALNEVKDCTISLVIRSFPEPDEIRMKAREFDEKDFVQWVYEIQLKQLLTYMGELEQLRQPPVRGSLPPLRKCEDCGTEYRSHGRCPECLPMG